MQKLDLERREEEKRLSFLAEESGVGHPRFTTIAA